MLKLNPVLIHNTDYILDDPDPVYKIREMGDKILDELYEEQDVIASKTGITLLECALPLEANTMDLYHDLYHLYKSMHGSRKKWNPKCTLQIILQSCMGYILHTSIPHLCHKYDCKFVKYMAILILETRCTLGDVWDVIIRRSLQELNETHIECTINALGWIDNETYWYLRRNTCLGLSECKESLGLILPYGDRYDTYISKSYIGNLIYERSPRWGQNYLKKQPTYGTSNVVELKMKDTEILDKYGMLPRYKSKQELIELLRDVQYNRMYEIHNKEKYYGRETCINMDVVDHDTRELFIVDNNLYTIDELVESCNNGMKFGTYPICKELAEDILYFLRHYDEDDTCDIIIRYLQDCRDPIVTMRHIVCNDMVFKQFLIYLIEVGLYTRRWRGHGKPYPYKASDTDDMGNKLYLRRMNELNIKIMLIVNSMEFSWYRDNIILHKAYGSMRKKFIPYYMGMVDGNECIRLMSESLIHTGSYYLHVIYGAKYKDNVGNILDINQLEFMNPISPEERNQRPPLHL